MRVCDGVVDDCRIDCHRLCYACVGMVSKIRSETLHVWAKTLTRLDDRATFDVSILLIGALQPIDNAGVGSFSESDAGVLGPKMSAR